MTDTKFVLLHFAECDVDPTIQPAQPPHSILRSSSHTYTHLCCAFHHLMTAGVIQSLLPRAVNLFKESPSYTYSRYRSALTRSGAILACPEENDVSGTYPENARHLTSFYSDDVCMGQPQDGRILWGRLALNLMTSA